jgi:hypothetical protein
MQLGPTNEAETKAREEAHAAASAALTNETPAEQEQISEALKDEAPAPKQGKLPEDFPGLAALDAAGIHTFAQLRKAGDVTEVPGIGPATAAKIDEAVNAAETTLDDAEGGQTTGTGGGDSEGEGGQTTGTGL